MRCRDSMYALPKKGAPSRNITSKKCRVFINTDSNGPAVITVARENRVMCGSTFYGSMTEPRQMFKRPGIREVRTPFAFVTETLPSGAKLSQRVYWDPARVVPTGTYGRVGEICAKMDRGPGVCVPAKWSPPYHADFIARKMPDPAAYMARVNKYYEENPPKPRVEAQKPPEIDPAPIVALFKKYPYERAPFDERFAAYRSAGYSEETLQKMMAADKKTDENSDKLQADLDLFFGKWPNASKPTPKLRPEKKMIKVVKKKMPGVSNE